MCETCIALMGALSSALSLAAEIRDTLRPAHPITTASMLAQPDLPDDVRAWLEAAAKDPSFAPANNPPGFVTDEACWDKAKRAAQHAGSSDPWAFATWWYQEHC